MRILGSAAFLYQTVAFIQSLFFTFIYNPYQEIIHHNKQINDGLMHHLVFLYTGRSNDHYRKN